jgi:hypothetical protein
MSTFDPKTLTQHELDLCLFEMRNRGFAVAIYDAKEIMTMTDGWENQPSEEEIAEWFDRDQLEELMCDAAREEVTNFVDSLDLVRAEKQYATDRS